MEWGNIIVAFLVERNKGIGILDTINEVASSLYHALIDELLERLFLAGDA